MSLHPKWLQASVARGSSGISVDWNASAGEMRRESYSNRFATALEGIN